MGIVTELIKCPYCGKMIIEKKVGDDIIRMLPKPPVNDAGDLVLTHRIGNCTRCYAGLEVVNGQLVEMVFPIDEV